MIRRRGSCWHGAQKARHVYKPKDHQHYGDSQLHAQTDTRWNDKIEKNDSRAHDEDGEGVAQSPESPNQCGPRYIALLAHDGADGDDMIGIGGVAHAEKESQRDDGEKADHRRRL